MNGDYASSMGAVIKTHILHVGEFPQSKDNGVKRDKEQRLLWRRIQLYEAEANDISITTPRG